MTLIDNLLEPLIPHWQSAADKCNKFGGLLLDRLDRIIFELEDEDPSPKTYVNRLSGVQANGTVELGKVPTNQAWRLDYVSASAAWTITLNGVLYLASTNSYTAGDGPIFLPGETPSIVFAAPTDYMIQVRRIFLDETPTKAHSHSGNENWSDSLGGDVRHEGNRDMLQVDRIVKPPVTVPEN